MHNVSRPSTSSSKRSPIHGATVSLLAALFATGCTEKPVSFSADILPVFQERCAECHEPGGDGYEKSGFSVASYEAIMQGTKFGPVIVPESSVSSSLMRMVEHKTDPKIHMPHQKSGLSRAELDKLRAWIDQGATNN